MNIEISQIWWGHWAKYLENVANELVLVGGFRGQSITPLSEIRGVYPLDFYKLFLNPNGDSPKEACLNFGQQCFKCLYFKWPK